MKNLSDQNLLEQQAGGAQPNVNGSKLKGLQLPVPGLSDQKKIVARLDSLSQKLGKVKELQTTTEHELSTLENFILSKTFSGE
jgi:type I restriction enzyme S subunit